MTINWKSFGNTENKQLSHEQLNLPHLKTLIKLKNLRRRKIRKSLQIHNEELKAKFGDSIKF